MFLRCIKHSETKLSGEVSEAAWFTPEAAEKTLFQGAYGIDMLHKWQEIKGNAQ